MKTLWITVATLALFAQTSWGTPLPTSNDVQRVTPSRCPADTIPVVNSQGTSGAAVAVSTHAKIVAGKPTRVGYYFLSDADFCGEFGSMNDAAPVTLPVGGGPPCGAGFLYKANVMYWQDTWPANRFEGTCQTGTCNVYTVECVP